MIQAKLLNCFTSSVFDSDLYDGVDTHAEHITYNKSDPFFMQTFLREKIKSGIIRFFNEQFKKGGKNLICSQRSDFDIFVCCIWFPNI